MLLRFFKSHHDTMYVLFRIIVGFLFFAHGAQKIFGWFGGNAAELVSLMGLAGSIELVGGLAIMLGFFTRLSALGSALLMAVAYGMSHASKGLLPIVNKGELAVLYFAVFLVILAHGAKKWSLEKAILKREIF
jgi:putative oxidoreductase